MKNNARKLPDWIDAYVKYTATTRYPPVFRMWSAVSAVASALQRKCYFEVSLERIYPNIFIVLIGPSGIGKSRSMRPARTILSKLGLHLAADVTSREALIRKLKKSGSNPKFNPDASETGFMELESSLTIHSGDLTLLIGYKDEKFLDILNAWYDAWDFWEYDTKHMGKDSITNVWVNMLAATTPTLLQESLPRTAIGGGFTSRVVFVYQEDKVPYVPIQFRTQDEEDIEQDLFDDLRTVKMLSGEFKMTEDFFSEWHEAERDCYENPKFEDPRFDGYNLRRWIHLTKLCMIVNASRCNTMILEVKDLIRAESLLVEVERWMPKVFSGVGYSDKAYILDKIMKDISYYKRIPYGEIVRRNLQDADEWTIKNCVSALIISKFCKDSREGNETFIIYTPKKEEEK